MRRDPNQRRGTPLNYNAATAARYQRELLALIDEMQRATVAGIHRLYAMHAVDGVAMDASLASQARILTNALRARFLAAFSRQAETLAKRMQRQVDRNSAAQLAASLKDISAGVTLKTAVFTPRIREIVKAGVAENVALIRSIPEEYFLKLQGSVMRNIQRGDGTAGILRTVEQIGAVTRRRAELIARDQTSKATTALNGARMQALGIRKFEWLHSAGGKEPRPLHVEMSGKVYSLDDPPVIDDNTGEKGLPGQLINCRCRMVPVLDFSAR